MGNMHASEYANAVSEGWASLGQAIAMNLQSNHFPPLPLDYVAPIRAAIDAANEGEWDRMISLGDVDPHPRAATETDDGWEIDAATLLDITHCWGFTDNED